MGNLRQLRPHVVRTSGPWSETVVSLLRHLEDVGFEGSPRVVGSGFDDDGCETVTFIEGDFDHPGPTTISGSASVGRLLRAVHDATRSYEPPADAVWQEWFGRDICEPDVVGHCDVAPWNVVLRDREAVAFIDWECAGPVNHLVDLAHAAWLNANLYSDDIAERNGLPPIEHRAGQLRAIVDGYGITAAEREVFVDLMVEVAIHSVASEADEHRVVPDTEGSPATWGMAWRARSASWMLRNRRVLEDALR